jgi:hypothetical protein
MTIFTIISLGAVTLFLVLLLVLLFGSGGVVPISFRNRRGDVRQANRGGVGTADASYIEVLNLADMMLDEDEVVMAGCGQRGEIENVILATNKRVLFLTRRFGASHYHYDQFNYDVLRPLSSTQGVIGEKMRLLEGDRIAEMTSPGHESWLDSAEDTVKVINERIRHARDAGLRR